MKNRGKYFLRFAGVCAVLGLVLMGTGVALGGQTQVSVDVLGRMVDFRPWGIEFISYNDYDDDKYDNDYDDKYDDDYDVYDDDDYYDDDDDKYDDDYNTNAQGGQFITDKKLAQFSKIDASMVSDDIAIEYGADFNIKIKDYNDAIKYSVENGQLKIWRKNTNNFSILSLGNKKAGFVVVTLPHGTVLTGGEINTVSGDAYINVDIDKVIGNSTSGDLEFKGKHKSVHAKSVSGDISSEGAVESLDFNTISGEMEIRGGATSVITASVSGDASIEIVGVRANYTVDATTVSGEIEIDNDTFRKKATAGNGNYSIVSSSTSGDIDIEFLR